MQSDSGRQGRRRPVKTNDTDVSRYPGAHLGHGGRTESVIGDANDVTSTLDELFRHIVGSHHDQDVHLDRA